MTNGEIEFQHKLIAALNGIQQQLKIANGLQKVWMCYDYQAKIVGLPTDMTKFNQAIDEVYEDALS